MTDHPREWDDLTPEQQAALVEFGKRLAEGIRHLAEAMNQLTVAAIEAHQSIEAMRAVWGDDVEWTPDTPSPEFGNTPT